MIVYDGPSKIDGKPIICIATLSSANPKTGVMVQTWIMRADIEPHLAIKTGEDQSICGDCQHRPSNDGSCYVVTFQAPLSVYRAYHRGIYDYRTIDKFAGMPLRLGSYGDPLAVPLSAWQPLLDITNGRTGYTHQWNNRKVAFDTRWKSLVMASADNQEQALIAQATGWRTFRVTDETSPKVKGESVCPASKEAGHKMQCIDCLSCSGRTGSRSKGIVINAHGSRANKYHLIASA